MILEIKVFPCSGRQEWAIEANGMIKCYLKSQPEGGKANREFLMLLAHLLGLPVRQLTIVSGLTTRIKRIRIPVEITQEALSKLIESQNR